ncbi:hypothetical protein NKH77_28160 [Streptomyces sp. M19]
MAGAATLALTHDSGGKDDKKDRADPGTASSAPATTRSPHPDRRPLRRRVRHRAVVERRHPQEYLGAWEGEIEESGESTGKIRRIVLGQGTVGTEVADALTSEPDAFCQESGTLKSADNLLVLEAEVTTAVPEDGCTATGEQTLRLRDDGSLAWSTTDDTAKATLRPTSSSDEPIPASYLGTWQGKNMYGNERATFKFTLSQGAFGTEVAETYWDGDDYHCEGTMRLVSVRDGLTLSTEHVTKAEPQDGCEADPSHTFTVSGDKLRMDYVDSDTSETETQTFTRVE